MVTPYTKISSNGLKTNIRPVSIKLLKESTGNIPSDMSFSNIVLDLSLQAKETKAKINK